MVSNSKGPFGFPIEGEGEEVSTGPFSRWAFRWIVQWIFQTSIEFDPRELNRKCHPQNLGKGFLWNPVNLQISDASQLELQANICIQQQSCKRQRQRQ